jgi:transmembrane 9 superfamily protein 2/4
MSAFLGRTMIVPSVLLLLGIEIAEAFYLPGLAPVNFCEEKFKKPSCPVMTLKLLLNNIGYFKSDVTLYVNKLDSDQSVIPFEYHRLILFRMIILWCSAS